MSISLYDASVPGHLQALRATAGFLKRGLEHAGEHGIDPQAIVEARLYGDMLPFRFQVSEVVHHSLGAIEGIRAGAFAPPTGQGEHDYAGLQGLVDDAIVALEAVDRQAIDACAGGEVVFTIGERKLPFTVEDFLFSFSLPNFYFHVTTAYDILRMRGVPLGKRDFLGRLRFQRPG